MPFLDAVRLAVYSGIRLLTERLAACDERAFRHVLRSLYYLSSMPDDDPTRIGSAEPYIVPCKRILPSIISGLSAK